MDTKRICPGCQKPLPPDVPLGLCPECLIKAGFNTGTEPGDESTGFIPPPVEQIAKLFPQLEIIEFIGKGGMGAVYKARQPALDRFVALKILPPRVAGAPGFAERFNREARALARLVHPNIVAVHDFGQAGELHYFIMEFVDGANLRELERAGRLPSEQALAIVPQICEALQFAHNEGIVHRDIKPENILLDKKGRVKITDFGIAKILGQTSDQDSLTGAKDVVGTPHYMAPEQIERPTLVDHRADIYSLGVVFYEMLTGELPLGKFQPPSQKVQVDVRLDEVVLRSLAKEPDLRYQNVSEVKTRVENIANTRAPAAAPTVSAEEILARDYTLNIRNCLRRGWALVRNDFWPLVGMSAFVMVVLSAASSSEVVLSAGQSSGKSSILGILLSGPLMGGLYLYFLKKIRREEAGVETAFTGFRHPFPHLVIAGFLVTLLTAVGFLCLILPGIYLLVAWIFTFPLIIDKRLDFWSAMRLSRKVISKHWWKCLGFLIVLALINLAGVLVCCVGLFVTFPISLAALMYAYEDVTGAVTSPPGASSSIPPIAPTTPPISQPDRFWRRFAVVTGCIVLIPIAIAIIAIIGMLAAIAIPNFVQGRQHAQEIAARNLKQAGIHQDASGEFRKDSSQSFPLNADGRFSLDHVKGRIAIHGWSSNAVVINAAIHGKTSESVEAVKINIDSDPNEAIVHTEQPSSVTGFPWSWLWFKNSKRNDADVDYMIQVPHRARLADISSVNGRIVVDGVSGDIAASTINGETHIKDAARNLKLSTVTGRITAYMILLGGGQSVSLDAVNGEVELAVPEDADANFSASTVNGSITSEFPALKAKKEFPVGNNLKGSLGNGSAIVKASAVNGSIKILKRQTAKQTLTHTPAESPATNVSVLPADEKSQPLSTNIGVSSVGEKPAISAAQSWPALLDDGRYSVSWKRASVIVQGAATEQSFANSMETFRKPLGDRVSRNLKSGERMTELPGAPDGYFIK
jgi:serine/threonine protein kinase